MIFYEKIDFFFSIQGSSGATLGVPGAVREGEMRGNRGFYIKNFDFFFFDSRIDFEYAGGPPMLTGPLPDPKTPPNPQKSIFPLGGGS